MDIQNQEESESLILEVLIESMRMQREILNAVREIQLNLAAESEDQTGPEPEPAAASESEVPLLTDAVYHPPRGDFELDEAVAASLSTSDSASPSE